MFEDDKLTMPPNADCDVSQKSPTNGHDIYYKEDGRMDSLRNRLDGSKIDEIDHHFTTDAVNDIFK